jgi:putative oxidoreductase
LVFDHIGVLHVVLVVALTLALYQVRQLLGDRGATVSRGHTHVPSDATSRRAIILLEITELALAAIFFLVGGAKLIGRPEMVRLFHEIGLGQWFRYVTGTIEVTGALLLIIPFLSGASAILLGGVMIVASLVELFVLHRPPIAAFACLSAHTLIAWRRFARTSTPRVVSPTTDARLILTRGVSARWAFPRRTRVHRSVHASLPYAAEHRLQLATHRRRRGENHGAQTIFRASSSEPDIA